jgi:hypothetical protein
MNLDKKSSEMNLITNLSGHECSIWVFDNRREGAVVIQKHHNLLPLES